MDEAGYHAHRRAAQEDAYYAHLVPTPNEAPHEGVEWVLPLNEAWSPTPIPQGFPGDKQGNQDAIHVNGGNEGKDSRLPGLDDAKIAGIGSTTSAPLANGDQAGTQKRHHSVLEKMTPHLQLMCAPMLAYYTIKEDVWFGAAMVVTADAGSVYDSLPQLTLDFAPSRFAIARGFDPKSAEYQTSKSTTITGHQLHKYHGSQGTFTFWRFFLEIPQQTYEQAITYRLNSGSKTTFLVPYIGQNFHWMAHSCNGFSGGVDTDAFKSDKFESGFDPVWSDVLEKHEMIGYHAMVGGGDQIYCDSITREPELQPWINSVLPFTKHKSPLTHEIESAIDRYYFSHYCKIFRTGAFGQANGQIPMVNMLDDHDLIDGFGSYSEQTMRSPIFQHIGSRGYFWFLLFQLFSSDDVDGTTQPTGQHPLKNMVIGGEGSYIPSVNHSLSVSLGPKVHMYLLDCRSERRIDRICSELTYQRMFEEIESLPDEVEQLIVQLGVPIVYPRMSFVEHFLESKLNPLNIMGRFSPSGLGGFSNKFDKDAELLDDLNDHWCAKHHKKERNWLVLKCQRAALSKKLRVTFLSGDVHCAAIGLLHTYHGHHGEPDHLEPSMDHRYMMNVITSAIVNTPPPAAVLTMVGLLAGNKHRTLHSEHTDEKMMPLFKVDTDESHRKHPFLMGRRNYCSVVFDPPSGNLNFDICVEKVQGGGETKGYGIIAPPPRW